MSGHAGTASKAGAPAFTRGAPLAANAAARPGAASWACADTHFGTPMPRTTKVLLVSNLFPTPADSVRGIVTARLAQHLQLRCELSVVCPLPWLPAWTARGPWRRLRGLAGVPRIYAVDGVQVHSPKYSAVPGLRANRAQSMFFGMARTVAHLHRERAFDV